MAKKTPIQPEPVVFEEFTRLIGGDPPESLGPMSPEQAEVRADLERILRTVQGIRRKLDKRQEEYRQLAVHVSKDVASGFYQDYVSGRISHHAFGKD